MDDMKKRQVSFLGVKYIALVLLIIIIWETASITGVLPTYMLPAPHAILQLFIKKLSTGELLINVLVSIRRVFLGFLIASVIAIVFGILISVSANFEVVTSLLLQILKPIPPIAWIPIAIIWLGIGEQSKIFIIFIGAFFPILTNVIDGIVQIDKRYFEVSQTFEISRRKLITNVMIPAALPQVMTGLKIGLGNAWICVVAAEMIAATSGIGYMLMDGRSLSMPGQVILSMIMVGVIGKIMEDILRLIQNKLVKY
ncbi:MAG: ABC transporter permease [Pseudobutyrivibrio ruminis]|nr:ABC transporter permease [Pseudobutyrivibrio ruminis]